MTLPVPARRTGTRLLALATAPLLALSLGAPALADKPDDAGKKGSSALPATVPLPDNSSPEGITDGPGSTFFAGSRNTGSIFQADVRTGEGDYLVDPQPAVAGVTRLVGLDHDQERGLVWTAGGTTGLVNAYDAETGELVDSYTVPGRDPATRFLNDVAADADAVYVTDSRNAELVVIEGGVLRVVPLTGDYVQPAGFGANGIVDVPGDDVLLTSGGVLYTVDPVSGEAEVVERDGGKPLTSGDGLELRGDTLYVTYAFGRDSIAVVDLGDDLETYRVVDELKDEDLERPTTSALIAGALYAVNGKFGTPGATEFEVVRVALGKRG